MFVADWLKSGKRKDMRCVAKINCHYLTGVQMQKDGWKNFYHVHVSFIDILLHKAKLSSFN